MENLRFTKLEAIGNNFVLINGFKTPELDWPLMAKRMSAHHFGAGSDGLLVLLPSDIASFRMRMFNPDGTEDACGNGLRCSAIYAYTSGLYHEKAMTIEAMDGIRQVHITEDMNGHLSASINMGRPSFRASDIPAEFGVDEVIDYPLVIDGNTFNITCIRVGTPHVLIQAPLEYFWDHMPEVSAGIENHPAFKDRISVTWYAPISRSEIKIRTWERAVGPTLGCGTGACCTLVNARIHGQSDESAYITSPGGTLHIEWQGEKDVIMSGPANIIFQGVWPLSGDEEVKSIA